MFTKKSLFKKTTVILLIIVTVLSCIPVFANAAISAATVTNAMTSLKENTYRQNWYWCGGNIDTSLAYSGCGRAGCMCNSFAGSYQCHGFALYMASRVTGSYPAVRLSNYAHGLRSGTWTCYTNKGMGNQAFSALALKPGDIVRASYNSSYSSGHTAIVWKIENGKVYFAEAWGSVYCKINWGGFNYSAYSLSALCNEYSYVAVWQNSDISNIPGECVHVFKAGYEGNHPHREYNRCTLCGKAEYTGTFKVLENCVCCQGTHSYTVTYGTEHPHYETKTCELCKSFVQTTVTKTDLTCNKCIGIPYNMEVYLPQQEIRIGDSVNIAYNAENAIKYTVAVKYNGTKTVASVPSTTEKEFSFIADKAGNYTVNLTAVSETNKSAVVISDIITVKAPITEVTKEEGGYTLTYDVTLDQAQTEEFCTARALTLIEHGESYVKAALNLPEDISEQYGAELYTYIPAPLSYHEIEDFCTLTGKEFAYAPTEELNELMIRLCARANSEGILCGVNDIEAEGQWVGADLATLEYYNWNPAYTAASNKYKNYLFMYPGGSWIDSEAKPIYSYGFVVKTAVPFSYTENEDGTLTLTALPTNSSQILTIPESENNKLVTAIADNTFANTSFEKVILPSSITHIGENAFTDSIIGSFTIPRGFACEEYLKQNGFLYEIHFPFDDVKNTAWYYEGIRYCYYNFYISGMNETTFKPNDNITREQFVIILANLAGVNTDEYKDAESGFSDVKSGQWYTGAVVWAAEEGYVSGISEGVFGRGQSIQRAALARLLYLYAETRGIDTTSRAELSAFADADKIEDWMKDGIEWAVAKGIISGMNSEGELCVLPKGTATRAQTARMLMAFDSLQLD